jgi:hypothetical protein
MSGKYYMGMLDEEAIARIKENKELENKIAKLLEHLPAERHGMILSSLLVQTAYKVDMPKEELMHIISDIYDVGKFKPN